MCRSLNLKILLAIFTYVKLLLDTGTLNYSNLISPAWKTPLALWMYCRSLKKPLSAFNRDGIVKSSTVLKVFYGLSKHFS